VARHPNSERFHQLLDEIGELHDRKQADYGREDDPFANIRASTEWGVPSWVGAMVRLTDKVRRLQAVAHGSELRNEGVEDSLQDIAVYALIALVMFETERPAQADPSPATISEFVDFLYAPYGDKEEPPLP
jgi:hypothetical protein